MIELDAAVRTTELLRGVMPINPESGRLALCPEYSIGGCKGVGSNVIKEDCSGCCMTAARNNYRKCEDCTEMCNALRERLEKEGKL